MKLNPHQTNTKISKQHPRRRSTEKPKPKTESKKPAYKRKIQADETEVRISLQKKKEIQSPRSKSRRSLQKKEKNSKVQDRSRNEAYKKKRKEFQKYKVEIETKL